MSSETRMTGIGLAFVPLILLAFWLWMFVDMTKNEALPPCFVSISDGRNPRLDWTITFIILNLLTAGYYYLTVYSRK